MTGEAQSDWRMAFASACIAGPAAAIFLLVDLSGAGVRPGESAVRIAHLVIFAVTTILLWRRRRRPTRAFCTIAAVIMWVPFFPSLWLSEETTALVGRDGHAWQPFVGHKLLFFGTAMLFPGPTWVVAAMLGALGLHALVLWVHLDLGAPAAKSPVDEPWAMLTYLAVAGLLLAYRSYHARAERELQRMRAEARALKLATEAFLVVRDLANTPLQTLELALALLRRRHVGDDAIIDSALRAIARLRALGARLPVANVTSASLDPDALERLHSAAASEEPGRRGL